MALKMSVAVRNAQLNAIETAIGVSPKLKLWTGTPPATIAGADSGTCLCILSLESNWMGDAANGVKGKIGTWSGVGIGGGGTATYFRIYASDGTTQHIQGTVSATSGDLVLDSVSIVDDQVITISAFTLTAGNG